MKNKKYYIICAFIYMNLLPYVVRIPGGFDWVFQYVPQGNIFFVIFALALLHLSFSIPAVVLAIAISASRKYAIPFILTFLTLTGFLGRLHYDLDLAADAQAALGLLIPPIVFSFLALSPWRLGCLSRNLL